MQPSFSDAFRDAHHQPFLWQSQTSPGERAALLVHGFPGTPYEMRPLAEHLHERDWTVKGVLLPGFGVEIDTLPDRQYVEWRLAVETALAELQATHKRVMLVGHSMGAALSIAAAARLKPDALILSAPFWKLDHVLWRALPVLRHVIPRFKPFRLFKPDFEDPETRDGIRTFMPHVDLDDPDIRRGILDFEVPVNMMEQVRRAGAGAGAAAPQVDSPALVLQGTRDELVRPQTTRRLLASFPQRPAYHEVDAEHNLLDSRESAWQDVVMIVDQFVQSHIAQGVTASW